MECPEELSVVDVFSWMCGEGWLAVLTPATLSDLSFVSSHPGPLAPHPPVPSPPPTKGPLG